jgi:hypothetical protein
VSWHNRNRNDSGSLVRVHRVVVKVLPPTFSLIQFRSPLLFWDKNRLLGVCPFVVAVVLLGRKTSDEPTSKIQNHSCSGYAKTLQTSNPKRKTWEPT